MLPDRLTDKRTNERMEICECRVAFMTEKVKNQNLLNEKTEK